MSKEIDLRKTEFNLLRRAEKDGVGRVVMAIGKTSRGKNVYRGRREMDALKSLLLKGLVEVVAKNDEDVETGAGNSVTFFTRVYKLTEFPQE